MPDNQPGSPRTNRPLGAVLRAGTRLSFHGEPGHAWFARASASNLPRRIVTLPAILAAEQALARQDRSGGSVGKRAVRIPAGAFVSIASRALPAPAPVLQLAGPSAAPGASAAAPGIRASRLPARETVTSVARTILFFLALIATVALAYWTGRMRGTENVIVVPGPSSDRSAIA